MVCNLNLEISLGQWSLKPYLDNLTPNNLRKNPIIRKRGFLDQILQLGLQGTQQNQDTNLPVSVQKWFQSAKRLRLGSI